MLETLIIYFVHRIGVLAHMDGKLGSKRSYDNSLRRQQQELTQETIMSTVQAIVLEGRLHNFTIQEVADRAGVSHGTVYRHFPSREAILEGLVNWTLESSLKINPPYPERLEDLPSWVEKTVPIHMPYLPAAKAMETVVTAIYSRQIPPSSRDRDELVARLVKEAAPELAQRHRLAVTAGLRLWISVRTWVELHTRYGLDEKALALAVSEGVRAQIQQLKMRAAEAGKGVEK